MDALPLRVSPRASGRVGRLAHADVYQARALLEVQGINEHLLNRQELDPTATADNSSQSYINTEAKLLQSSLLFDRVAQRLNSPHAGSRTAEPCGLRR